LIRSTVPMPVCNSRAIRRMPFFICQRRFDRRHLSGVAMLKRGPAEGNAFRLGASDA
jgi:hypothetical protein